MAYAVQEETTPAIFDPLTRLAQGAGVPFLSYSHESGTSTGTVVVYFVRTSVADRSVPSPAESLSLPLGPPEHESEPALAATLRSIRQQSNLTWDELAKVLGVSRRAVHNWVTGGRMTSYHAALLEELRSVVGDADAGDPARTRAALLAPRQGRPSIFAELVAHARPAPLPTRTLPQLLGVPPAVDADEDDGGVA